MRPQVGAEQIAQVDARAERGLALADPFQNAVAPLPVLHEGEVLIEVTDAGFDSSGEKRVTFAPLASAASAQAVTRSAAAAEIIGPTTVCGSAGSPVRIERIFAKRSSRNCAWTSA